MFLSNHKLAHHSSSCKNSRRRGIKWTYTCTYYFEVYKNQAFKAYGQKWIYLSTWVKCHLETPLEHPVYLFLSTWLISLVFVNFQNNMYWCKFFLSLSAWNFCSLKNDVPICDLTETLKTSHLLLPYNLSMKNEIHFVATFFDSENELKDSFLVSLTSFEGSIFPTSGLQHSSLCLQTFG